MVLTPYDLNTPTWKTIETYLTEKLDRLRKLNDAEMPESARNKHIGQIQEVKALLALKEPAPIVE